MSYWYLSLKAALVKATITVAIPVAKNMNVTQTLE
jgi:hypothetical protein